MRSRIFLLTFSTVFSIFAYNLAFPRAAADLVRRGASGTAIGLLASSAFFSICVLGPVIPRIVRKVGAAYTFHASRLLLATGSAMFLLGDSYQLWFAACYLIGVGAAFVWPLTEGAIVNLAPEGEKGLYSGYYQTGVGLALAAGPLLSSALNMSHAQIFRISTLVSLGSWALAADFPWERAALEATGESSPRKLRLRDALATGLLVSAFVGGLFQNGLNAISIPFGVHLGLSERAAMSLAGWIGIGGFLAPAFVGKLLDRIGIQWLLWLSLTALLLSMALLFFIHSQVAMIWPLAFFWGAMGAGLYTVSMASVAYYFSGAQALGASTLMISIYTLGAVAGPFIGGFAFDLSRDNGVAVTFFSLAAFACVFQSLARRSRRVPTP